jgi:competence protein ComFC
MTNSFTRSDGVEVDLIRESHCIVCSKPIPLSYKDYGYCMDCKDQKDLAPELIIYGVTEYILKDPVERLSAINREIREFKHDPSLAGMLGECLVHVIMHRYPHLRKANLIVPVPSSNNTRDYNPATLLAECVSAATGIPCEDLLSKDPASPRQHEQPADRKCVDIIGMIRPKRLIDAESVLLIDDTVISGCTMRECARVLKKNGAVTVYGLAVGRGIDRKRLEYLEREDARHG